ncbi:MAG: GWxTD domain-containing protein [Gemmatimonadaceae bacterium]
MSQANIDLLRTADTSLRLARRLASDSGRYALDLGRYFLYADLITLRVQAPGQFRHAFQAARRVGDSSLVAEALDELGMVHWRRYEVLADRRLLPGLPFIDLEELVTDERNVRRLLSDQSVAPKPPLGMGIYEDALSSFKGALDWDPGHTRALRHVYMALAEKNNWEALREQSGQRRSRAPYDPLAWLAEGLANHRLGDAGQATIAFDSALALLSDAEHEHYTDISRILRLGDSVRYKRQSERARKQFSEIFWLTADPLAITSGNELWLEFLTRVTYAELRWTSDDFDLRGANSDRGQILVRYGPPGVVAAFAAPENQTENCRPSEIPIIQPSSGDPRTKAPLPANFELVCSKSFDTGVPLLLWYYPELNLHFVFRTPPTYGTGTHAGPYAQVAVEAREAAPAGWTNIPVSRFHIDSVKVVVSRFKAPGDSTDALVVAEMPIGHLVGRGRAGVVPVDVAFVAYDHRGRTVRRDSARQLVDADAVGASEIREWRQRVGLGATLYRVEALEPDSLRAARALGELVPLPWIGFGVSDLLVAQRVRRGAHGDGRWSDFEIEPSVGTFALGQSVGLLWETYWLTNEGGKNRYQVVLTLEPRDGSRGERGFAAKIIDGFKDIVGLSAQGIDRVQLEYTREMPAQLIQVDHLSLDLGGLPPGQYRLALAITDIISGRSASRHRDIDVTR